MHLTLGNGSPKATLRSRDFYLTSAMSVVIKRESYCKALPDVGEYHTLSESKITLVINESDNVPVATQYHSHGPSYNNAMNLSY